MAAKVPIPKKLVDTAPKGIGAIVLGLFFFSGACGLMYEIIWMRDLRLVMGNTVFSTTTVLCAFMGGLALGSYVGGRIIDRRKDPLRIYALMEGAVGLYCLVFPTLLDAAQPIYRLAYAHFEGSFYLLSLMRFFFSGLVLIVPATLMGATLPILGKFFIRQPHRIAWRIGRLYALNTFGAVLGAAMAGLFLLPAIGVKNTLHIACAVNLLVSAAGLLLHYRLQGREGGEMPEAAAAVSKNAASAARAVHRSPALIRFLLIGYGLSGFAAMVYEVAWTRLLSLVVGSTVYAFSLMLIAFILGLALGSLAYSWFLDRGQRPVLTLAAIEVGIGLSALAVVPILGRLPLWIVPVINAYSTDFFMVQLAEFGIIFALMLIPTTLMGAAFPLASRIYAESARTIGRSIGNLYASNTLGSILGSALAGFLLVPLLGIEKTAISAALLNVALGCGFLLFVRSWTLHYRAVTAVALLVVAGSAFAWLPTWDPLVLSSGPYRNYREMASDQPTAQAKVLFHEEGIGTTVTVRQIGDTLTLTVNGKADASNGKDIDTQELLAHVPLLLHEKPKDVLIIGLGSGITAGSACRHPVERVDCVEICPSVIRASRLFKKDNYDVLNDARLRLIVEDGRNHLLLTQRKYDVIISEPSNPYIAGVSDLFTKEFYDLCRSRLKPGGIVCAWTHTYNMKTAPFLSIVRTFQSSFSHTTLWQSRWLDSLLIGSLGPLRVDVAALAERMASPEIARDLSRINIHSPADFLANLVLREDAIAAFAGEAPIHTDDNAMLEFSAPLGLYASDTSAELVQRVDPFFDRPVDFLTAAPSDQARLRELAQTTSRFRSARRLVLRGPSLPLEEARAAYKQAFDLNPDDPSLADRIEMEMQTCRQWSAKRQFEQARIPAETVLAIDRSHVEANARMGAILASEGKPDEGEKYLLRAVTLKSESQYANFNYASWLERRGDAAKSLEYFQRAIKLAPSWWEPQLAAGELLLAQNRSAEAVAYLTEAARLAPDDPAIRVRCAKALEAAGKAKARE